MRRTGFTLIELLVVIGIIGMLVAIAIPNFLSARQRASDSRKKQEMQELKMALRLYYNDYYKYPCGVLYCSSSGNGMNMYGCGSAGASECLPNTSFATVADNVYMKQLPSGFLSTILYYQVSSGDDFCLSVLLDNKSDPDILTSQNRCRGACSAKYPATNTKYWICAD